MRTGLEVLLSDPKRFLKGRRAGLVCHPASVLPNLTHAVAALHGAVRLAALFGPQHGIRGETQANMIEWEGYRDAATGLPVHSLYGETREPTAAMLEGLKVLIVDLQDVGARPYTYASTLALCMKAAAAMGIEVLVLDRPNPLGGEAVDGPMLEEGFRSFVGLYPVPMRHGLTMGELARLFREAFGLDCPLTVIPMEGWRRKMDFEATGLPWVLPSPNMPTPDTAFVYPGMILLEATTLSEGRGTTRPFEIWGAPGLDGLEAAARLNALGIQGVRFRGLSFQPTFDKHAGKPCGGVQLHVTDRRTFPAVLTGVAALQEAGRQGMLAWLPPPYEYERVKLPIDILAGSGELRRQIEAGIPLNDIAATWTKPLAAFRKLRKKILLYD